MGLKQFVKRHIIFVICLALIGYGIIAFIYIACPEKIGHSDVRGQAVAFAPIYNKSGSTFHAKLGIGYKQALLVAECIVCMLAVLAMYKMIAYYNMFFGINMCWIYFVDFGGAAVLGRLPMDLMGFYTLDYLYIAATRYTYDFFDICIGICIVGVLLWCVPMSIKYHKYKVEHTKGMKFLEKLKWEVKFSFKILGASLRPIKIWWK